MNDQPLEFFFAVAPSLEPQLLAEARALKLAAEALSGGVTAEGDWPTLWRACRQLRGASRVLVRVGAFPAAHLAELDKKARRLPWARFLDGRAAIRVEATCAKSKIYHQKAAAERVAGAIHAAVGAPIATGEEAGALRILARIEANLCTVSLDAAGGPMHRRGVKQAVGKAPMRETLAALMLRACGYDGAEPVVDPMCGSGAFVIEAAEIAAGLIPGRGRRFDFERFASFDAKTYAALVAEEPEPRRPAQAFLGSDRDAGAAAAARENAERADIAAFTRFETLPISDAAPPDGPPGLVMVNPPYGVRIGDKTKLHALYAALGATLRERFQGWRVGLVTSEPSLARATGLPFDKTSAPIPHGALKVRLYRTGALR